MKILVVGGNGTIGKSIVTHFIEKNEAYAFYSIPSVQDLCVQLAMLLRPNKIS